MNRLSGSTSPYLLQHASNPVDWHPWGPEALALARRQDRPIFLSIGYAACHWCHVMAHESFEDPDTAALMNEHFVCIKVDREERPDLDGIYMAATQALTGSGGWPMSVFLTPDLQPFYAGTYFPPVPRHNLPAFRQVLSALAEAWINERERISGVAGQLKEHLGRLSGAHAPGGTFTHGHLERAAQALRASYDWQHGGWGPAPKFPQPMAIEFLLRLRADRPAAGGTQDDPALHALQAMARGGMYDVVGGGFARYSTDPHWRVPHFEKMLYDNAQLAAAYLSAWQATGDPFYRRIVAETLAFVRRELTGPEGGFYSSLDADSQGEEGRFYVWTAEELETALDADYPFFQAAYGVTAVGNWEGRTVLQRALDDASLAARFGLDRESVPARLADCHARLLAARSARPRPATDDKVLAAWNGLMLSAFARAAAAFDDPDHLQVATRNADFLRAALRPDGRLRRAWRDGRTTDETFLEDYAALALGLLDLYQADFDPRWFAAACELVEQALARFADPAGGFFDTPADGEPLLIRPKDLQDNATPSGNALMAEALLRLAAFTGNGEHRQRAETALGLVAGMAAEYPTAFGRWLGTAAFALAGVRQVAILGDPADERTRALVRAARQGYRPFTVLAAAPYPPPAGSPPLLAGRPLRNGKPTAYVCREFTCKQPVNTPEELRKQLEE